MTEITDYYEDDDPECEAERLKQLYGIIEMGAKARDFFYSDLGIHVRSCADIEIKDIQDELLNIAAADASAIRLLQMKARACRNALRWLTGIIDDAELVQQELSNEGREV